jgi:hypothetical protein
MSNNSNEPLVPVSAADWRERTQELREAEWKAHKDCLQAAQHILENIRGHKSTISDLTKLLDLASKLGRLATGMATEQVEHAWSQYHDPRFIAQIEAEVDRVFGKPIDVKTQVVPPNTDGTATTAE